MDTGTQTDDSESDGGIRRHLTATSFPVKIDDEIIENSVQTSDEELSDLNDETIEVNQLSSVSKYKISVVVEETPVEAVVDTGSDVTIISEEVFKKLKR